MGKSGFFAGFLGFVGGFFWWFQLGFGGFLLGWV